MNSRRNFLKTVARGLVAGSILGTGGFLLLRAPGSENCDFDFPCNSCNRLSSCGEQKAMDFKNIEKGERDE